jgi:DivIVA domain-containing protein
MKYRCACGLHGVLSLVFLANGVLWLRNADRAVLDWIFVPLGIAWLMSLVVPGIVSRRRAGVPWWRFGRVMLPPSVAGFTGPGDDGCRLPGPAGTPGPGPAMVPDARISGLIERIKDARFSTTRLSQGYDEEEVDVFLDKLIAVLGEGGRPDQGELRNVAFTTTRLRPGYDMQDVDGLLREIAQGTKV